MNLQLIDRSGRRGFLPGLLLAAAGAATLTAWQGSRAHAATELVLHTRFYVNRIEPQRKGDLYRTQDQIAREIGRQALLVAARDGLGMRTCDATLREKPRTDNPLSLLLTVDTFGKKNCTLRLYRSEGLPPGDAPDEEQLVWSKDVKVGVFTVEYYPTMTAACEKLSRTEFPKLLTSLGGEAATPEAEPETPIDPEELLSQVDLTSQFVATRELHRRLQSREDATTLRSLIRGYANLGHLTETNWGASSAVFKARSLIYARRLTRLHPKDGLTPWASAYAYAMLGSHINALNQLEGAEPPGEDAESWAGLIDPVCRFETKKLAAIAAQGGNTAQWATYLHAWAMHLLEEHRQFARVGRKAIASSPGAFGLYSLFMRGQSIGSVRYATATEMQVMLRWTPSQLVAAPGVPESVVEAVKTPDRQKPPGEYWRQIVDALRGAESPGELSWSALAGQLEEQAMAAACNSVVAHTNYSSEQNFEAFGDYWLPFLGEHPDRRYVAIISLLRANRPAELQQAIADFRFTDPQSWMKPAFFHLRRLKNSYDEEIGQLGFRVITKGLTAPRLLRDLRNLRDGSTRFRRSMRSVMKISPDCPTGRSYQIMSLIAVNDPPPAETLREWEGKAGESSRVWSALAQAYELLEMKDDSVRCYEASLELSPENRTFTKLANAHKKFGNEDKYIPTLERYLEYPDAGIGHERMKQLIAEHLIGENRLAEAKAYALEAAVSYSYAALEVAGLACELLGEVDQADHWYGEASRSYPTNGGTTWYEFRRRAGIADLDAARQLALRRIGPEEKWGETPGWTSIGYCVLEGDERRALEIAVDREKEEPDLYTCSFLLMLAVRNGDDALVQQCNKVIRERAAASEEGGTGTPEWASRFAELMLDIQDAGPEDEAAIEQRVQAYLGYVKTAKLLKADRGFFLGGMLEHRGFREQAAACYEWAYRAKTSYRMTWRLAGARYQALTGRMPVFKPLPPIAEPQPNEPAEPAEPEGKDSGSADASARVLAPSDPFPPIDATPRHGQGRRPARLC